MRAMIRALLTLCFACILAGIAGPGFAAEKDELPSGVELPVRVRVGLRVIDITEIKEVGGRARLFVEVTQRWNDPRRRFDPLETGAPRIDRVGDEAQQFVGSIWTPGLVISNQLSEPQSRSQAVSAYADGDVVLVDRYEADFRVAMDMQAFPFDRQQIALSFSLPRYPKQDAVLVTTETDRLFSRVENRLTVIDWRPLALSFAYDESTGWNARSYSQLNATVGLERMSERYLLRLFIPIISTLAVSIFVLWLPGASPKDSGGLVFSALLALAAISFTFEASFPGSISLNTPIAKIISLGYLYLVLVVLIDGVVAGSCKDPASRFHVLACEVRGHTKWALPAIMTIVCAAAVIRAMPV
ncbi:hypothetical protein [Rhodopseudomonas palustris]|uniref:Neurotransmitter-gated ion-channel ligand-binding domain-containing protein n=1 Tax=Rhodopseudomonas palustris (strain BisB18) TaxID=316056 RepID=Q214Y5_RHOPB